MKSDAKQREPWLREERKKKKAMNKHLGFLLGQTER